MMSFFDVVQHALELKLGTSADALLAAGPALDAEPDLDPNAQAASTAEHRRKVERFGKRCFAFLGSPDSKLRLLIWSGVGSIAMSVHHTFSSMPLGILTASGQVCAAAASSIATAFP